MIKKINYYSYQEILNIYPDFAPRWPHDTQMSSSWFIDMLDEAGLEPNAFTLNEFFSTPLLEQIVNALMTVVYERHADDFIYSLELGCNENHVLDFTDFRKAMNSLINVINLTITRYVPLLQQNEIYSLDPVAQVSSSSYGKTRFNDTPQDGGDFNDDEHATNVSESSTESYADSGSIMERLSELFKDFRSIILEWSNEFNQLFLKEEQIV